VIGLEIGLEGLMLDKNGLFKGALGGKLTGVRGITVVLLRYTGDKGGVASGLPIKSGIPVGVEYCLCS
jgi:hypothetical protein